jgi:hypothetical protein
MTRRFSWVTFQTAVVLACSGISGKGPHNLVGMSCGGVLMLELAKILRGVSLATELGISLLINNNEDTATKF